MEEIVRYFREYAIWIYLLLGIFAIFQIRKFAVAWEELRNAAFGMERDRAQERLNQHAWMLLLILMMTVAEFTLVSFVAPTMPGAMPLPSPTLDLRATATSVLSLDIFDQFLPTQIPPTPTEPVAGQGCTPGQVVLTAPKDGSQVSGVVSVEGIADIPNFGFYKYEVARPGETIWLSIVAGENVVQNGKLGEWVTTMLPPGEYMLRLIVVDSQGVAMPACVIQVNVVVEQP